MNCRFDPNVETAAYRIIQEGLTNAARYAETDHVQVRLSVYEDILYLRIEDQGVGFDPEFKLAAATSNGLTGMQERAALLGGKLKIVSSPKNGTQIFVEIPVREEAKDL